MALPEVDWQRFRGEVAGRIDILEAAWKDALKRGPVGEKIIADLYKPILETLVPFLACFTDGDEKGAPLRCTGL